MQLKVTKQPTTGSLDIVGGYRVGQYGYMMLAIRHRGRIGWSRLEHVPVADYFKISYPSDRNWAFTNAFLSWNDGDCVEYQGSRYTKFNDAALRNVLGDKPVCADWI